MLNTQNNSITDLLVGGGGDNNLMTIKETTRQIQLCGQKRSFSGLTL
jgi:hypothetical protein